MKVEFFLDPELDRFLQVVTAVQKAVIDAKRGLVTVPLSKDSSFPHKTDSYFGAAKVGRALSGKHTLISTTLP